jgi:hypothetical protein
VKNLSVSVNLFYKDKIFAYDIKANLDLNYKVNDNLSLWVRELIV